MNILSASESGLAKALEVLRDGGVVIHATETCYGIAADLTNRAAVEKLFQVKARPLSQPVSALFPSIEDAKKFVIFSDRALTLAKKYLPGPLTLVLPVRNDAPEIFVSADTGAAFLAASPTIGVRISSHPFATALARAYGKPIATTSANLHGQPNPYSLEDLESQFGSMNSQPDLILDGGTLPLAPPSTVVQVIGETITVLRQGELVVC